MRLFNLFRVKLRRALKSTSWAITVKRNRVKLKAIFKIKRDVIEKYDSILKDSKFSLA